jgi:hypothetical protein
VKKPTIILLTLTLAFISMGAQCDDNGPKIPNPGFGVVAVDQTGVYEKPFPGAVTDGAVIQAYPDATGFYGSFHTVGGNSGQSLVDNGKAPAFYLLHGIANWGRVPLYLVRRA